MIVVYEGTMRVLDDAVTFHLLCNYNGMCVLYALFSYPHFVFDSVYVYL